MIASVSPEAEREIVDSAVFYATEANAELGLAFVAEFERSLALLLAHPHIGTIWRRTIRRLPLRRFPYSIIYQVVDETVRVIALAHQNRRPDYWVGRK